MSDKQGLTYEQKFEVLRLRAEGLGYRSIANELGVKRDQVRGFTRTKTAQRLAKKRGISLSDIATVNTNKTKKARKLNCKNCQRVYVKKESDINSTVYCSEVCKKELADKRKQEAIDKKTRPCVRCGELYVAGNGQQRYCSKECLYETLTCEACGDTFTLIA